MVRELRNVGDGNMPTTILSFYIAQLGLITTNLSDVPEVDVRTVDSYQGRGKERILVSLLNLRTSGFWRISEESIWDSPGSGTNYGWLVTEVSGPNRSYALRSQLLPSWLLSTIVFFKSWQL
jgi:hypothetical protein